MKIAVIYHSVTGTVRALAEAVAEGAAEAGGEVRLRRVADADRAQGPPDDAGLAELADLAWADAYAFGTPTRFGAPAAQLKQFIDQAVDLWREGVLAGKPVTAFTSAYHRHGGHEATILSLSNVFYHWGSLIVPPGYTDPAVSAAGGNPYGTSALPGQTDAALDAARHQGRRLATVTSRLLTPVPVS